MFFVKHDAIGKPRKFRPSLTNTLKRLSQPGHSRVKRLNGTPARIWGLKIYLPHVDLIQALRDKPQKLGQRTCRSIIANPE
jgi:hypothetical protein